MSVVQVICGAFFILLGLAMLVRPQIFANGSNRTPPTPLAAGVIVVGGGLALSAAQSQAILVVLSILMSIIGIVLIITGLMKLRRKN